MPILHWLTRDEDIRRAKQAPYRLFKKYPNFQPETPMPEIC